MFGVFGVVLFAHECVFFDCCCVCCQGGGNSDAGSRRAAAAAKAARGAISTDSDAEDGTREEGAERVEAPRGREDEHARDDAAHSDGHADDDGQHLSARMSVISHWSVVDVTAWAEGCAGVAPFAHLFAENSLSGQDLLDLTHADLLSMGLSKLHDRKVVFRAIQQLLTGNEPLPVEV